MALPDRTVLLTLAACLGTSAQAMPPSASASGNAAAQIVQPISATAVDDLDFGVVAVSSNRGGSVTVAPGQRKASFHGGASPACNGGAQCATPHPARFHVIGEPGRDYGISLPASVVAHADSSTSHDLQVIDLEVRSDSRRFAGPFGSLDNAGHDWFEVGGQLVIPPGTPSARYRATIEVIVGYT